MGCMPTQYQLVLSAQQLVSLVQYQVCTPSSDTNLLVVQMKVHMLASTLCFDIELFLVLAAELGKDFTFTEGSQLEFREIGTSPSLSFSPLVVPIINDNITEPCESFICTLQASVVDAVRDGDPNRVTIQICDDDREHM